MSIPSVRLHRRTPDSLKSIRIVLVSPSHPGNVGAAARAMRTMGLEDLALVAPRDAAIVRDPQAVALASGATAILDRATVYPTLEAAIAQIGLAVAVSADMREFGPMPVDPRTAAAAAIREMDVAGARSVAFVFGPERTGLSIPDVQRCRMLCSIPADPSYASLNLAQAVQVIAFCLREAACDAQDSGSGNVNIRTATSEVALPATGGEVEAFLEHLQRALVGIGYLDPAHPKKLMPRMRRLFVRAELRSEEIHLLRGVCKMMEKAGEHVRR